MNCAPSWTAPVPGRYVLDTDGVVAYAEVKPDDTRRPDPKRLLSVLSAMKIRC
jgi:peroxiredoxin